MSQFIKTLNIGDRVGVQHCGSWSSRYTTHTVKNITKTGQVTIENGDRFTNHGELIGGSKYHGTYLRSIEDTEAALKSEETRRERNIKHNNAIEIVTGNIRQHKNGHGDYFPVTVAERDMMIAAIMALEVKDEIDAMSVLQSLPRAVAV